jgi:hypothetical protein
MRRTKELKSDTAQQGTCRALLPEAAFAPVEMTSCHVGGRLNERMNAALLAGTTVAARRSGYYARNNPWVAAAVRALTPTRSAPASSRARRVLTQMCVTRCTG